MTQQDMDQAPPMITFTIGEVGDQLVLSIPEASIKSLESEERERTIIALSRFVTALGNRKSDTLEEDLIVVAAIEGMLMTVPGNHQPLTVQEVFGSLLVSGSPEDVASIQAGSE